MIQALAARTQPLTPTAILGLALAAGALACIAPVALVDVPAMVDYPNHLARMSILARAGGPDAHPLYEVAWGFYPNLGMDLVVPLFARLIGVEAATRLFCVASLLTVVGGAVALEWAVKRRVELAGFMALLFLYSIPFAWGFVNFTFAFGVSLFALAGWIACEDRSPRLRFGLHALAVAVLFVCHLFALGLYGVAAGLHALWRAHESRTGWLRLAWTLAGLAAPAVAVFLAMIAAGGSVGGPGTLWGLQNKPVYLIAALNGFHVELSALLTSALLLAAYILARMKVLGLAGAGGWMLAGFTALFLVMPMRLLDTAFMDVRVVVAGAIIVPAFVTVRADMRLKLAAGLLLLTGIGLGQVIRIQFGYARDYREIIRSFAVLEPGARVLVGHSAGGGDPPRNLSWYPVYHAPVMAVHYANAFVPTLFTYPGKQPVLAGEAVRRLDIPQGGPELLEDLRGALEGRPSPPHIASWARDFDVLYLVGEQAGNPMPDLLEPMASGLRFAQYRIRRPGPALPHGRLGRP